MGSGLFQATHLSFIGSDDLNAFGFPIDHPARRTVIVKNPLREEEEILRTTLLPALLASARYNLSHGAESVALFETGKVFFDRPDPDDSRIPDQPDRVGFVVVGALGKDGMDGPARPTDVYTATAIWRLLETTLGIEATLKPASVPGLHPGRGAEVVLRDSVIGVVGELHPSTAAHYDLPGRVAVGELDLGPLVESSVVPSFKTPSTYPPVEFDLAFACDVSTAAVSLLAATTAAGGPLVESSRVFDEYTGMGTGRKSIAIRFVLRAPDRTLTNEEVAPLRQTMIEAALALGAELRGGS